MDRSRFRYNSSQNRPSKDIWDWWLSDEPPSAAAREEIRRKKLERANTYRPRSSSLQSAAAAVSSDCQDVKSVVINLSLPKLEDWPLKLGNLRHIKLSRRRLGI